ncbi:MAG: hypothetical protein R3F49_23955 [Planctomycetota bacterium]
MLIATLLLAAAPAQGASATVLPNDLHTAIEQLLVDAPGDGRIWARGTTYKASFGPDGFVYVPAFGSEAPRNFPLAFKLASATVGGAELALLQAPDPRLDQNQDGAATVAMARGDVTERYHVDALLVEQTFEFAVLPERGELRLRLDVTTDLRPRPQGSGFVFEGDLGDVHYGAATALDAAGRSLALEQRWSEGGIEIVVPASFVREAELPLVVDPVISTATLGTLQDRIIDVDTAFVAISDLYQVVFSVRRSMFDHDVLATYYDPVNGPIASAVAIDISSENWNAPRNASCYDDQAFLCVANVGNSPGFRRVRGRVQYAPTANLSPSFDITTGASDNADVGGFGNDTSTAADFLVVYQAHDLASGDIDIRARTVSSGGGVPGAAIPIADGVGDQDLHPSISKSSGRPELVALQHEYMIVWEREVSATNHDVWARVVGFQGNTTGHSAFRAYSFSDARHPDVSSQNTLSSHFAGDPYWGIAFERLVGTDYDIFVVFADDEGADNARNVSDMQDLDEQAEQLDPRIAHNGRDYIITYLSESSPQGFDAFLTALNPVLQDGEVRAAQTERRARLAGSPTHATSHAIASMHDGGVSSPGVGSRLALAVWPASAPSDPNQVLLSGEVEVDPSRAVGTQFCDAQPTSGGRPAWISVHSLALVGLDPAPNQGFRLRCSDLPPHSFGYFLASLQEGTPTTPAGSIGSLCLSGAIGRYAGQVLDSGADGAVGLIANFGQLPQPTMTTSAISGEWWHFQYWTRDSAGGVPTSNFSNAARVWIN